MKKSGTATRVWSECAAVDSFDKVGGFWYILAFDCYASAWAEVLKEDRFVRS